MLLSSFFVSEDSNHMSIYKSITFIKNEQQYNTGKVCKHDWSMVTAPFSGDSPSWESALA